MALQDPSQADAERRFLLALLLSTVVLLASPYLLRLWYPVPDEAQAPKQESAEPATQGVEAEPPIPSAPAESAEPPTAPTQGPTQGVARTVEVVGQDLAVRFATKGAVAESARLLQYSSRLVERESLELIPQDLPDLLTRPLALRTGDGEADRLLDAAVYELEGASSSTVRAPAELTFRFRSGKVEAVRRYHVPESGYLIACETSVKLQGRPVPYQVVVGPGIGRLGRAPAGSMLSPAAVSDFAYPQIAFHESDSVQRFSASKAETAMTLAASPRWVAFDSQFFAYLVHAPGNIQRLSLRWDEWKPPEAEDPERFVSAGVELGESSQYALYLGPKDLEVLREVDPTLTELVDYGWFGILVHPLLFVLKLIYGQIHNYGWAIIILTFLINLALVPIRYKQVTSMKKMSALQPKMKAIQERYKKLRRDDPKRQEMNREIMALYQEHGVNPLGGCLPLLIQMPFLFAFYRMLAASIELRGAPFMLWIQDLSQHDPYYVTPIASGVMMMAQQRMTPAVGDPMQRRMMMIMPVMLTYFFLWVSSGLAIYFLFSTFFGILFQLGIQKMEAPQEEKPSSKPKRQSRKGKSR